jgi:hypothetical protein
LVRPPDGDTSVSRSLTAFIPPSLPGRGLVADNSQVWDELWKNSQEEDEVVAGEVAGRTRVVLRFQRAFYGNTKSIG